jgi:hypothetical protein
MNQSTKYALHLDDLRRNSKLTVKTLCDNIVDPRNYRRYLTGERTLTHVKIVDFCERLNISSTDFYYSARKTDIYEFQQVNKLYKLIGNRDFNAFNSSVKGIKRDNIIDTQNLRFYDFCILKIEFELNKKTNDQLIRELSNIIDYPSCCEKTAFDFVDLITLQLIAEIESKFGKDTALNKLISILNEPKFIYTSSEANNIIPSIYSNVSLFLLRMNRYQNSKEVALKGIDYSLRYSDISGLAHLYYVLAFSSLKLGNHIDAELNAVKCVMTAVVKNDKYEIDMFTKTLTKDFGVDPFTLIARTKSKLKRDNE